MPKCRLTREQYDLMLVAFRDKPGNYANAAKVSGVTDKTARRAWLEGWERPDWARPIHSVFDQEHIDARNRIQARQADKSARLRAEREQARIDAAEERVREAMAVRGAINTSLMLFGNLGLFSKVSQDLSRKAAEMLAADVAGGNVGWQKALDVQSRLALTAKRATEQLTLSMEALRKHIGEPEKILGVMGAGPVTTVDEQLAFDRLGEAGLKKAVVDLIEGRVDTPEATALIELQVASAEGMVH